MKILAIETATDACSAALYLDGELTLRYRVQPRRHTELILRMMDELLAESGLGLGQLDALGFGRGPGSFTGVRIATGVIQGAAFGADLPVVPVSTLAALAQRCFREQGQRRILPAYDARMNEIYLGGYLIGDDGLANTVQQDMITAPGEAPLPVGDGWVGVGSGWKTYADTLSARFGSSVSSFDDELLCNAWDVALLAVGGFEAGHGVPAEQALPVYLRDRVAWKRKP